MSDTALRQLTMLQLVPGRDPGRTTREIQQALAERGFDIDLRSVQRDLDKLSGAFPLITDEGQPPRWRWIQGAGGMSLPALDPFSALSWQLVADYLRAALPYGLQRELEPRFEEARAYLQASEAQQLARWRERVRILPRKLPQLAPDIAETVLEAVYRGLLEARQVLANYRRGRDRKEHTLRINPLALVIREELVYLLANIEGYSDIRQMALHRFLDAELTDEPASEPVDFDLDRYIEQGGFAYATNTPITLVARFDAVHADVIREAPLATDQVTGTLEDARMEVRATVLDSAQLRWWLAGFGAGVEVVAPESLRGYMAEQHSAALKRYRA